MKNEEVKCTNHKLKHSSLLAGLPQDTNGWSEWYNEYQIGCFYYVESLWRKENYRWRMTDVPSPLVTALMMYEHYLKRCKVQKVSKPMFWVEQLVTLTDLSSKKNYLWIQSKTTFFTDKKASNCCHLIKPYGKVIKLVRHKTGR